jgi:hypothetical protein
MEQSMKRDTTASSRSRAVARSLSKVGMARRRRPIFAATPPLHPPTAHPRLKLGTPTARRPYHFFTRCYRTTARQRPLKLKT